MKLQSKKARVPIAALGVTALVCGAGALVSPAFAVGTTLAFGPTAASATIVNNVDPTLTTAAAALSDQLAYGLKVTGSSDSDPLRIAAPVGNPGSLYVARVAGNGTPASTTISVSAIATDTSVAVASTAGLAVGDTVTFRGGTPETKVIATIPDSTHITVSALAQPHLSGTAVDVIRSFIPVAAASAGVTVPSYANGDNIFVTATVPGDYTFTLYKDHNGNSIYDAAQDDATPTFTLHVKDVIANTVATSDDLDFGLTAPTTSGLGQAVLASATLGGASTTDTRGGTTLGDKLAAATTFTFTGTATGQAGGNGVGTFDGTKISKSSGAVTVAGSVISTATLGSAGTASATTTVAGNGVTGVVLAATDVAGSVAVDAVTTTTNVKNGTATVTHTATVANSVTASDIAGKTVYFTLGGTDVASLTTDGTTVDASAHIFSAVTNSTGVASLKVTDGATTPSGYTVAAKSNNVTATGGTRTVVYGAAAATSIVSTNTDAELTPTVAAGVTVTLKGKILDQFGGLFTPALAANQVVTVTVPAGVTTVCSSPISAGLFSCVYTPATTPVAGTSTTFRFAYTGGANPVLNGTINWASTVAAAAVTLTTPKAVVTGAELSDHSTISPGQSNADTGTTAGADADDFGDSAGQVTGVVKDATGVVLAFKSVTLSGGDGVYFSSAATPGATAADDLQKTMTVVTNASGVFSGAYAFFTKAGTVKVTATSGTVSADASVTTDDSTDPYFVTVNDVTGTPGSTLIVTGTIKDAFLNPVPGFNANLSIGTSTLGAFGDSSPETNAAGVFSTTFTSGSNQSGTADLVATLPGQSANRVPVVGYIDNAGLTIAHGEYMDTAKITLAELKLTLVATAKLIGGGKAEISGKFTPNTGVDIYSRPSGAASYTLIDSVTTDAEGEYGAAYSIKKTTAFLAKSAGLSSKVDVTQVFSKVSLTGKSTSHNRATLSANGAPSAKGTLTFYRSVAGKDPVLKSITSNTSGNGTVTVKLPKGSRKVYVIFKAPGTGAGTSKTITVNVK
jgi:hypothetical protein